jgi:hypothetical protein
MCSRRGVVLAVETGVIEESIEVRGAEADHRHELTKLPARDLVTTVGLEREPEDAVFELAAHLGMVGLGETERRRELLTLALTVGRFEVVELGRRQQT